MAEKPSKKRSHDPGDDENPEVKRFKRDLNILDLSDCVLTLIFEYVSSFDLYALSLTCTRFSYLTPTKRLWTNVDVRKYPMCARKFKYFYSHLNDATKRLLVTGVNQSEKCITTFQFHRFGKITSNLTVLAMEYQYINTSEIQLRHFPPGLKELSLRGTQVAGTSGFFQEASVQLKCLHTLVLDDCLWVREHSLMALSKLNNLENLSLYNCKNLSDSVAYMSITTRFGFKKLLRIDARLTKMGDQFLKCLNNLRTIREIYLESPMKRSRMVPRRHPVRSNLIKDSHRRNVNASSVTSPAAAAAAAADPADILNRTSSYCTETFRPCTVARCTFVPPLQPRPPGLPTDRLRFSPGFQAAPSTSRQVVLHNPPPVHDNVIVVAPFENPQQQQQQQQQQRNDVRVHVLYANEAPFDFERQNGRAEDRIEEASSMSSSMSSSMGPLMDLRMTIDNTDEYASDGSDDPNEILYNLKGDTESDYSMNLYYESTVSDEGIRWFTASDPNTEDYRGEESMLFQRFFSRSCYCNRDNDDFNQPGPSGSNVDDDDDDDDDDDEDDDPPQQNGANNAAHNAPRRINQLEIVLDNRNPLERRDLRVVIERVEPGIQIIVNNNNNNNNNNQLQNNATRLKVFAARNFKRLTDRAMQNLSGIRLELLDVTGTSVTAEAVKRFLMVNPDCRVVHESTCACRPR